MTRDQKISKLANAIREWRGAYNPANGKWIRPPNPSRVKGIARWLGELKRDTPTDLNLIQSFKTYAEFNAWIKTL